MKGYAGKVSIAFCALLAGIILLSFSIQDRQPAPEVLIKNTFLKNLENFSNSITDLQYFSSQMQDSEMEKQELKLLFLSARNAYKKIEFLLAYLDAEAAEDFNGGNIPSGDPNILSNAVIEPKGLQVLEELIFSETNLNNKKQIHDLCRQLLADTKLFSQTVQQTNFTTTAIFDACRKEILRVCFLGLTGFDSPVAKNSIPEAIQSLQTLQNTAAVYSKYDAAQKMLQKTFADAISYLQTHADFDTFDRLYFIKTFGNGLYSQLLDLHIASGAAYPEKVSGFNLPLLYDVNNLFAENLLNPLYYSPDKAETYNAARVALGKVLFFDPVLSANNKRACASCHQPSKAFTDGLTKSTALDFNGTVKRNAPTLVNAIFQGNYFYDMRAEFPETQIDHVVFHADEFNSSYELIIQKLQQSPDYVLLFQKAFPEQVTNNISTYSVTKAIADYIRSLVAMDSEFDKFMRNESAELNYNAKNGFNLFMGKAQCGTCHFAPTFYGTVPPDFTESETEVVGVPETNDTMHTTLDADAGRYDIQNVPVYKHAFKTSTVRNISLTAPYMHNGVYTTLDEVMDFYNRGGAAGLHLELEHQTLSTDKLNLTKTEIADIIAFMQSLTDTTGVTSAPAILPQFPGNADLNARKIGGEY